MAMENSYAIQDAVTTGADGAFHALALTRHLYGFGNGNGFQTETRVNVVLTAGQIVQLDFGYRRAA